MRRPRSRDELVELYHEQWSFLRRSAEIFDGGETAEAKRLAATVRLLVHDTKRSKSLLSQLGLKNALFFDTAKDIQAANLVPTFGLVQVHFVGARAEYVAPLARPLPSGVWLIPFEYWWAKPVVVVPGEFRLTRADLILIMANEDGGAHVDPTIDERYYRVARDAALNWSVATQFGLEALANLEGASVRQIAHELMVSLVQPRRVIPNDMPIDGPQWRTQVIKDASTGAVTERRVELRPLCPCRSGMRYTECHAKGGVNEGKVTVPVLPNER
jgi:hypothetical protein